MSERVTRSQVYGAFREFCKVVSKVCRDEISETKRYTSEASGSWYLEYAKIAGYRIEEVVYKDTKQKFFIDYPSLPFGEEYRPAREMVGAMSFAMTLVKSMKLDRLLERQNAAIQKAKDALRPDIVDFWSGRDKS